MTYDLVMTEVERQLLVDLRRTLLQLHKTLLDWERAAYERVRGRVSGHELLHIILSDPQFAWLRAISELVVHIDEGLDHPSAEAPVDIPAVVAQARTLVVPDEAGSAYAQRYHAALQELPDAVFAHRAVTAVLKNAPEPPRTTH